MTGRALALVLVLLASACEVEVVLAPPADAPSGLPDAGTGEDGGAWDAPFLPDGDPGQDAGIALDGAVD